MSHISIDMGSCGLNQRGYSISSPVFSGEVGARAAGGAIPRRVFRKDYPLYGMYGNPGMFPCEIRSTEKFYSSRNPESH